MCARVLARLANPTHPPSKKYVCLWGSTHPRFSPEKSFKPILSLCLTYTEHIPFDLRGVHSSLTGRITYWMKCHSVYAFNTVLLCMCILQLCLNPCGCLHYVSANSMFHFDVRLWGRHCFPSLCNTYKYRISTLFSFKIVTTPEVNNRYFFMSHVLLAKWNCPPYIPPPQPVWAHRL